MRISDTLVSSKNLHDKYTCQHVLTQNNIYMYMFENHSYHETRHWNLTRPSFSKILVTNPLTSHILNILYRFINEENI